LLTDNYKGDFMLESLLIQCSQADLVAALKKAMAEELSKVQLAVCSSDSEVIFTKKEAAAFLKVSLPTLRKYINSADIPCYRVGQNLRFKKGDLIKSLKLIRRSRRSGWGSDDTS
jgi:excisionase family DNA binding protein